MNNVIATGPDTFYYTNFLSTRDTEESKKEFDEGAGTGSIGYYNGTKARILIGGFQSSNGINISPDGKLVI